MLKNPITTKPDYKELEEPTAYTDDSIVLQPKVDGSHSLIALHSNRDNDIYSYRISKRTGKSIDHSAQIPKIRDLEVPKFLDNTVIRGDLFGKTKHGVMPAEQIGGILNASLEKSFAKQRESGWLRPYVYNIEKFHGKDVSNEPYAVKFQLLKKIESALPQLEVAETAFTPEEKKKLVEKVKKGKHPDTVEGVVEWNLNKPGGDPAKVKFRDNFEVYIRNIFPAVNQKTGREKKEAGGFEYSLTPKGEIVGNVGTGFDRSERIDMLKHPEKWVGEVARVKSQQQYGSGALRAPSFYTLHVEKNLQKAAYDDFFRYGFVDELEKIAATLKELNKASVKVYDKRVGPPPVQRHHEEVGPTQIKHREDAGEQGGSISTGGGSIEISGI